MSDTSIETVSNTMLTAEQLRFDQLTPLFSEAETARLNGDELARRIWGLVETSLAESADLETRINSLRVGQRLLHNMLIYDDHHVGTGIGITVVWLDVLRNDFDKHTIVSRPEARLRKTNERFADMVSAVKDAPVGSMARLGDSDSSWLLHFGNEEEKLNCIREMAAIGALRVAGYDAFPASPRERGSGPEDPDMHTAYVLVGDEREKVPFWPRRSNAKTRGPNVQRPKWTELVDLLEATPDGALHVAEALAAYPELEKVDAVAMAAVDALAEVGIYAQLAGGSRAALPRSVGHVLATQLGLKSPATSIGES